jgi:hypothetical protein
MRFFGLDPARHMRMFLQTVTPFVAYRALALRACSEVTARWAAQGQPPAGLSQIFAKLRITEFMVYGASILADGQKLESLYDPVQPGCQTLWASEVPKLLECLGRAAFAFGIHTEAWKLLSYAQMEIVAAFWLDRGLVASFSEGLDAVRACGAGAAP